MNPRGLRDLDPLGNHKHSCASRAGVYIGFRGHLNPVDPSVSSYNLYLYLGILLTSEVEISHLFIEGNGLQGLSHYHEAIY